MTNLPDSARESAAFLAYNAMETTKRRHFDYLGLLESRKKNFNLDPTAEQKAVLGELLQDHDHTVKQFQQASLELREKQPEVHELLFRYIGRLNETLNDG